MPPKKINVTEVIRELSLYDLECETLVGYEDCDINICCNDRGWDSVDYTIELIKTRPETDKEYDKRLADAKKDKERELAAKGKKLKDEKREYERLKKKFDSAGTKGIE